MNFGQALEALKDGRRVARAGWNGKGMWLHIHQPNSPMYRAQSVDTLGLEVAPYIEMKTADDKLVPWLASQTDVLADDWEIVEAPTTERPTRPEGVDVCPRYGAPYPRSCPKR